MISVGKSISRMEGKPFNASVISLVNNPKERRQPLRLQHWNPASNFKSSVTSMLLNDYTLLFLLVNQIQNELKRASE